MPDPIEPPVQTETGPSANDVFHSVGSFEKPGPDSAPIQQQPAKPEAPPAETQTEKPQQTPKDGKSKSRLDSLGGVKKPEEKKEEPKEEKPAAEGQNGHAAPEPKNPPELRKAYEKAKADAAALRAELDKIRPDFEKVGELRAELDTSKQELARLKAMNLSDEERTNYGKLRELHALAELRESKEFQSNYIAPIQQQGRRLEAVAQAAKLSPAAFEAIKNAMDIGSELERKREIRRILKEVPELPPEDFTDFYSEVVSVGDKLNNDIYPKMEAAEKHALEIEQAARTKTKQEAEQSATKEKETLQKEREFVRNLLRDDKLKVLFDDTDLSVDGVTLADAMDQAEPADNPRDRAYEVQAGAALPFMIEYLNRLLAKNHELETANKIRNGASPSRGDGGVKPTEQQGAYDPNAANSVFRVAGGFGGV